MRRPALHVERGEPLVATVTADALPHAALLRTLVVPAARLAGLPPPRVGTSPWHTAAHRDHMLWLVGRWRGEERPLPYDELQWAGPLREYALAAFEAVFRFLHDPLCVRHAATFSLLPA